MALVNRISRLFKADFHAVLDQLEEPEQVLRQAIRDMEDELCNAEQRLAALTCDQESLAVRVDEMQAAMTDVSAQLDLCFRAGKDELARKLIRKKLEADRLLKRLMANQLANQKQLTAEHALFDENSSTLDGLRQKAELFARRAPASRCGSSEFDDVAWMARELSVSDEEIEIAFLREQDARSAS
jgi:phage shock protein A